MDAYGKALDLMFRRIPAEIIERCLRDYLSSLKPRDWSFDPEKIFLRYAETTFPGYSEEEKLLFYRIMKDGEAFSGTEQQDLLVPFRTVLNLGRKLLCRIHEEPACRYEKLNEWREVYYLTGQDLIVTGFLAEQDLRTRYLRSNFGWAPVLRSNHERVNHILSQGIAENHRHLNGSTQVFELNWITLMNDPCHQRIRQKQMNESLQGSFVREHTDTEMSLSDKISLAAMLRTILFRKIIGGGRKGFRTEECYQNEYVKTMSLEKTVQRRIGSLRFQYGAEVLTPEGIRVTLDYAISGRVLTDCETAHYRVLTGERWLLYQCFRMALLGQMSTIEQMIFYLYLVLKTWFRGELIQVNREVGFRNFMHYQNRKDVFWEGTPYEWEAYRMAVNGPVRTQNIIVMESRITPKDQPEENIRKIRRIDRGIMYAEKGQERSLLLSGNQEIERRALKASDFYVMHFIKEDDQEYVEKKGRFQKNRCRHQVLRRKIREESIALAKAFSRSEYFCERVRGIDACNLEINCRPEVFAHAYRFLSGFHPGMFERATMLHPNPKPNLARTYHAGEEFYSIPDGLRAIDEAIRFLELRRGDRLGHALALGVDPKIHHQCKSHYTVLPRQNYLDSLTWMLFRGMELDVDMPASIRERFRQQAENLLGEIYGEAARENRWELSLRDYYASMRLRADDPEEYRTQTFKPDGFSDHPWDRFSHRKKPELDPLRKNPTISGLYYSYQYGEREKKEGAKPIQIEISPKEEALIRELQDRMIDYISQEGLSIEANLTSNVLIGTFQDYQYHPIFRFHSGMLSSGKKVGNQVEVSINTDDLGIFDTSLDFEYALLYRTMDLKHDEEGNKLYQEEQIAAYLQRIRDTGMRVAFRKSFG